MAASRGSAVMLSCRYPSAVNHAEWDLHRQNVGTPTVLYDGAVVNPNLDDKYQVDCNLTSTTVCDLRINHLQHDDVGEYQCYLVTDDKTLKFVYRLSVIGTKESSRRSISPHRTSSELNCTAPGAVQFITDNKIWYEVRFSSFLICRKSSNIIIKRNFLKFSFAK